MVDGYAGDITAREAWGLLNKGARLVDVRTHAEWSYVGVPDLRETGQDLLTVEWVRYPDGAPNTAFVEQLRAGVGAPEPDTTLVFLCRSGVRSIAAARAATAAGFAHCYNVLDGFEGGLDDAGHRGGTGWRADGLPWRQG